GEDYPLRLACTDRASSCRAGSGALGRRSGHTDRGYPAATLARTLPRSRIRKNSGDLLDAIQLRSVALARSASCTMPKLLLVTYPFPPPAASGSFRMLGLARHLPAHGGETIVVAPPRMPLQPVDPDLARHVPPETVIHHVPYPQGRGTRP